MEYDWLSLDDVLAIHRDQVTRYGGSMGVRDVGLLQSALEQPKASFGGQLLHADVFEMAAAYLFHIVSNHPFIDGNKRAGAASALVFLLMNGVDLDGDEAGLEAITLATAQGQSNKEQITAFFRGIARAAEEGE